MSPLPIAVRGIFCDLVSGITGVQVSVSERSDFSGSD